MGALWHLLDTAAGPARPPVVSVPSPRLVIHRAAPPHTTQPTDLACVRLQAELWRWAGLKTRLKGWGLWKLMSSPNSSHSPSSSGVLTGGVGSTQFTGTTTPCSAHHPPLWGVLLGSRLLNRFENRVLNQWLLTAPTPPQWSQEFSN